MIAQGACAPHDVRRATACKPARLMHAFLLTPVVRARRLQLLRGRPDMRVVLQAAAATAAGLNVHANSSSSLSGGKARAPDVPVLVGGPHTLWLAVREACCVANSRRGASGACTSLDSMLLPQRVAHAE